MTTPFRTTSTNNINLFYYYYYYYIFTLVSGNDDDRLLMFGNMVVTNIYKILIQLNNLQKVLLLSIDNLLEENVML